ncbi:MAG: pre-peptidase C-terminal domain-containing protein [Planctomycetota bacterium]|nr:pre-peptidase C-terminal domain-containing protein [Planctomycetota bacterium]
MLQLQLEVGDRVTIKTDTSGFGSTLDSYLRLFDSRGQQQDFNNNAVADSATGDSEIDYTATERGLYYVGVSAAHNPNYSPLVAGSGIALPGSTVTSGGYAISILVATPYGPERIGNRLNLPDAHAVMPTGLPATFVEGAGGVRSVLPNTTVPVYAIPLRLSMPDLAVADAIHKVLAEQLAGGNLDGIKQRDEVVNLVEYGIGSAGKLGISGPSDPNTALAHSGLFGDRFSAFAASADRYGTTPSGFPGAQSMQRNKYEGVYIDDIVIGFAGRGEMATNSNGNTNFIVNPVQPGNEVNVGPYQLEIRQASEYGITLSPPPGTPPYIVLNQTFDIHDRLTQSTTVVASPGYLLADAQTFSISNGVETVTFEFDDRTRNNGVASNHVQISFDPSDSAVVMAQRIRDAINLKGVQDLVHITAASADGVTSGASSTSDRVNLSGDVVTVAAGVFDTSPSSGAAVAESNKSNDTLATATATGIVAGGNGGFRSAGVIGDNPALQDLNKDVDLFRVDLAQGEIISVNIDAGILGSPLDSYLRVFDAFGQVVMVTDFLGNLVPLVSDDNQAPGEAFSLDSYLVLQAPTAGAYYLGVSGYNNSRYNPTLAGSGTAGSNGRYQLTIQRPLTNEAVTPVTYNYKGDANLFRDQGQTIISDNRISNSSGFGIVSAPGTRTTGEPHPGVPQNLSQINTSRLAPGVTITNNLLVGNGLGGIDFRGDAVAAGQQLGVVPFGRIINNTVVGDPTGATPRGVGIRVANNAAPTLMNNVLVGLATGVNVDQSSTSTATVLGRSTILGGTLYQNNIANSGGTGNIGTGTFPIIAAATEKLFVNPAVGNFYPAAAAPQIDSSVDSLDDRFAMVQLRSPMGISSSPILAPTRDLSGQVRVDDTNVPPLPGLGENVFKDRGALERGDFESPTAKLVTPEDNGPHDADSNANAVSLVQASLDQFSIQLSDGSPVQPGSGIDNATINGASLRLLRDGQTLVEGEAYSFAYDATSHIIRVIPLAGTWEVNRTYVIELFGQQRLVLGNVSGAALQDGASFDVTDQFSNTVTFEYDSGYVVQVPETLDVLIPLAGGGTNGVADGDTITVSQQGASTVTFELDNNKVVTSGNVPLTFVATNSQGEIADKLVDLLKKANLGLSPVNAGSGLVHLGVDGTQTLSVQSLNITSSGSPTGIKDGQKFTIDNGTKLVTFEFASHGATTGNVAVPFTLSQTNIQIAASLKAAISGAGLGLLPNDLGQGRVQVGGTSHHVMVVNQSVQSGQSIQSALILSGQPGARPAFGIRIPTTGGAISKLLVDGETFKISHGAVTATFEFDSGTSTTPGNIRIPFGPTTTPNQLADAMVSAIRNAGLGLLPSNATYGVVTLGGDATYSLDLTTSSLIPSSLTQLGQPGVPEATAIPFVPDAIFTAEQVAQRTVGYINSNTTLVGVQAVAQGGYVAISGAASVVSGGVQNVTGIKDLAGNPLAANRADGSTVFTVYIGDGLNYGQAPQLDPLVPGRYPTLRVDDGARHKVVSGFSLGPTESIMVDGSPRVDASGDGVAFDATTPLMPGRPFNLIVSPRGIGTVVATAFLDGWIDFNGDGVWDSDEQIIISRRVTTNGDLTINGLTPGDAIVGPTYARFRLSTTAGLLPTGLAAAGEVEDYLVTIERSPWQNPSNRFDVDGSKLVTPIDVLTEINYVNSHPDGSLPTVGTEGPPPYYDVDGNGRAEPADILAIISEINSPTKNVTSGGEGESAPVAQAATAGSVVSIGQESLVSAPAAMSVSGSTIDSSVATLNSASSNAAGTYGVAPAFVGPSKNLQSDLTLRSTSPKKPNHLNDILADDYDWSSIAEDVDKALQKEDARDAVFASLGV